MDACMHACMFIRMQGIVNKRLWAAAETGDNEEIVFLCRYLGADVNTVDLNIYNYTALFWAAMNGHNSSKVASLLAFYSKYTRGGTSKFS